MTLLLRGHGLLNDVHSRALAQLKDSDYVGALLRVVEPRKVLQIGKAGLRDPLPTEWVCFSAADGLDLSVFQGSDVRGLDVLHLRAEPSYATVFSLFALYRQFLTPHSIVIVEGIDSNDEMRQFWRDLPFEKLEGPEGIGLVQLGSITSPACVEFFRLRMALYQRPRRRTHGTIDGYATHYAVLAACVARTQGPVLELGCGNYSTPMLHLMCRDRKLVSLDNTPEWLSNFSELRTPRHEIHQVDRWDDCKWIDEGFWDVVFVDHSPPERRILELRRLMHRARYIVVHDTEDPCYLYESVFPDFKHRYDYRLLDPWTTVLSNFEPFLP